MGKIYIYKRYNRKQPYGLLGNGESKKNIKIRGKEQLGKKREWNGKTGKTGKKILGIFGKVKKKRI